MPASRVELLHPKVLDESADLGPNLTVGTEQRLPDPVAGNDTAVAVHRCAREQHLQRHPLIATSLIPGVQSARRRTGAMERCAGRGSHAMRCS